MINLEISCIFSFIAPKFRQCKCYRCCYFSIRPKADFTFPFGQIKSILISFAQKKRKEMEKKKLASQRCECGTLGRRCCRRCCQCWGNKIIHKRCQEVWTLKTPWAYNSFNYDSLSLCLSYSFDCSLCESLLEF